jgi:hypothetical protein
MAEVRHCRKCGGEIEGVGRWDVCWTCQTTIRSAGSRRAWRSRKMMKRWRDAKAPRFVEQPAEAARRFAGVTYGKSPGMLDDEGGA